MKIENVIFDYFERRLAAGDGLLSEVTRNSLSTLWGRFEVCKAAPFSEVTSSVFGSSSISARNDSLLFVRPRLLKLQEIAARTYPITSIVDIDPPALGDDVETAGRISSIPWQHDLYEILHLQGAERSYRIQHLLDEIIRTLSVVRPRAIVLWNDSQYLERAVVVAAKALHIPTITVQHGLILPPERLDSYDGQMADYMLVWSDFYKRRMCESQYISADRVYVLGYPYDLSSKAFTKTEIEQQPLSLCFFGQNWEKSSVDLGIRKSEVVSRVVAACKSLNIPFRYRTHPSESPADLAGLVPEESLLPRSQSLAEAIAAHSHFMSIASTALIEAGLYGKTCIQVFDPKFEFDDMQQVGACYSCTNDSRAITDILTRVREHSLPPMPVSPDFFFVNEDLGARFTDILREILDRGNPAAVTETHTERRVWCILGPHRETNDGIMARLPVHQNESTQVSKEKEMRPWIAQARDIFPLFGADGMCNPILPSFLEFDVVYNHWRAVLSEIAREDAPFPIVVADPAACFTLPTIRKTVSTQCVIAVSNPMRIVEPQAGGELVTQWISAIHAAIANSQGLPAMYLFPHEPEEDVDSKLNAAFDLALASSAFTKPIVSSTGQSGMIAVGMPERDFIRASAGFLYEFLKGTLLSASAKETESSAQLALIAASHTYRSVLLHLSELSSAEFRSDPSTDAIALRAIMNSTSYKLIEKIKGRLGSGPLRRFAVGLLKKAPNRK